MSKMIRMIGRSPAKVASIGFWCSLFRRSIHVVFHIIHTCVHSVFNSSFEDMVVLFVPAMTPDSHMSTVLFIDACDPNTVM